MAQTVTKPAVQYSDVPEGATVVHDPAQYSAQYSDIPEGATVVQHGTPPDERTSYQVREDQAKNVLHGIGIPTSMAEAGQMMSGIKEHPLESAWNLAKGIITAPVVLPYQAIKAVGEDVIPSIVKNSAALREAYGGPPSPFGAASTQEENERAAQGAGKAFVAAQVLPAAKSLLKATPATIKSVLNKLTTPENLSGTASNLRLPPVRAGLGAELAVPSVAGGVGHMIAGPEGAAALSGIAETVMRLRQSPMFRGMAADKLESVARWMVQNDAVPAGQGLEGALPPTTGNTPLAESGIEAAKMPRTSEGSVRESIRMETPGQSIGTDQYRPQYTPRTAVEAEPLNIPRPKPREIPQSSPAPPPNPAELNRWMNVQPKQLVYGNNPAEQVLTDNLLGPDKAETLKNVISARKTAGAQMESAFKNAEAQGVRFDLDSEINAAIADAKKVYGSGSDESFMKSLENLQDQFVQHNGDLKNMTPSEAHTFEKDLSAGANYGSMARSDITRFLRDLRSRVNKQLKAEIPEIAPLKDKWGNLYEAEKSLKSSIRRDDVGRGSGPIPPTAAGQFKAKFKP